MGFAQHDGNHLDEAHGLPLSDSDVEDRDRLSPELARSPGKYHSRRTPTRRWSDSDDVGKVHHASCFKQLYLWFRLSLYRPRRLLLQVAVAALVVFLVLFVVRLRRKRSLSGVEWSDMRAVVDDLTDGGRALAEYVVGHEFAPMSAAVEGTLIESAKHLHESALRKNQRASQQALKQIPEGKKRLFLERIRGEQEALRLLFPDHRHSSPNLSPDVADRVHRYLRTDATRKMYDELYRRLEENVRRAPKLKATGGGSTSPQDVSDDVVDRSPTESEGDVATAQPSVDEKPKDRSELLKELTEAEPVVDISTSRKKHHKKSATEKTSPPASSSSSSSDGHSGEKPSSSPFPVVPKPKRRAASPSAKALGRVAVEPTPQTHEPVGVMYDGWLRRRYTSNVDKSGRQRAPKVGINTQLRSDDQRSLVMELYVEPLGLADPQTRPIPVKTADVLASKAQRALWKRQHPTHCDSARFLLYTFENGAFAKDAINMMHALSIAYSTKRVLLTDPRVAWVYTTEEDCPERDWTCYFRPLSGCDVISAEVNPFEDDLPEWSPEADDARVAVLNSRTVKDVPLRMLSAPKALNAPDQEWWMAQMAAYVFSTRQWVTQRIRREQMFAGFLLDHLYTTEEDDKPIRDKVLALRNSFFEHQAIAAVHLFEGRQPGQRPGAEVYFRKFMELRDRHPTLHLLFGASDGNTPLVDLRTQISGGVSGLRYTFFEFPPHKGLLRDREASGDLHPTEEALEYIADVVTMASCEYFVASSESATANLVVLLRAGWLGKMPRYEFIEGGRLIIKHDMMYLD